VFEAFHQITFILGRSWIIIVVSKGLLRMKEVVFIWGFFLGLWGFRYYFSVPELSLPFFLECFRVGRYEVLCGFRDLCRWCFRIVLGGLCLLAWGGSIACSDSWLGHVFFDMGIFLRGFFGVLLINSNPLLSYLIPKLYLFRTKIRKCFIMCLYSLCRVGLSGIERLFSLCSLWQAFAVSGAVVGSSVGGVFISGLGGVLGLGGGFCCFGVSCFHDFSG